MSWEDAFHHTPSGLGFTNRLFSVDPSSAFMDAVPPVTTCRTSSKHPVPTICCCRTAAHIDLPARNETIGHFPLAPFMAIIAMRREQSNAQCECGGTEEPAEQVPYLRQRRRRSGDPRP